MVILLFGFGIPAFAGLALAKAGDKLWIGKEAKKSGF
jgi:hypothetical protein